MREGDKVASVGTSVDTVTSIGIELGGIVVIVVIVVIVGTGFVADTWTVDFCEIRLAMTIISATHSTKATVKANTSVLDPNFCMMYVPLK